MLRRAIIVCAAVLLAGCAGGGHPHPQVAQSSTSQAHINGATVPGEGISVPPPAPPLSITCVMGWVNQPGVGSPTEQFQLTPPTPQPNGAADYRAYEIAITASASAPATGITVNNANIVWYAASGQELSSGSASVGVTITAGQTLRYFYDQNSGNPSPAGAATCTVLSYN